MKTTMKLCVLVPFALTVVCLGDALGCSAPQRAAERDALTVVAPACPLVAALVAPGVDGKATQNVCLGAEEAADLLRRLLARRTAAHAYAQAHPSASVVPSAVLDSAPCSEGK